MMVCDFYLHYPVPVKTVAQMYPFLILKYPCLAHNGGINKKHIFYTCRHTVRNIPEKTGEHYMENLLQKRHRFGKALSPCSIRNTGDPKRMCGTRQDTERTVRTCIDKKYF